MTPPPTVTIYSVFADDRFETIAYRLLRWTGRGLLGWTGSTSLAKHIQFHVPCLIVSIFAVASYLIVRPAQLSFWAYVGAGLWGGACYAMIWFPHLVIEAARTVHCDLDIMFPAGSTTRRTTIARTFALGRRPYGPLACGLILAAVALATALGFGYQPDTGLPISICLTLAIGFLVGHSTYYILACILFVRTLGDEPGLEYSWIAPLLTPGLKGLSDALRLMAQLGLIMCAFMSGALVTEFFSGPVNLPLWAISAAVSVGVVFIVLTGVAGQHWLASKAREERDQNIRDVMAELNTARVAAGPVASAMDRELERLRTVSAIYQALSSSPASSSIHRNGGS